MGSILVLIVAMGLWGSSVPETRDGDACWQHRQEVRFHNYGYDHVVIIDNGCEVRLVCTVTTNVREEAISVEVDAGEEKRVLTYRASPAREFVANVDCIEG